MARLTILEFPDPRLRTRAKPVEAVTDSIRELIDDMFETMYAAPGIGLAATQVNVHQRIITIDVSELKDAPHVFINPQIINQDGEQLADEGCLSVPGFFEPVTRFDTIEVSALDRDGNAFTLQAEGLLSQCIQHECDHLEGKLFVDHISSLKRTRIRKKLEKQQRLRA